MKLTDEKLEWIAKNSGSFQSRAIAKELLAARKVVEAAKLPSEGEKHCLCDSDWCRQCQHREVELVNALARYHEVVRADTT